MRMCRRCKQSKTIEAFSPSARLHLGEWCRTCHAEYCADRYQAKKNGLWKRTRIYVRGPFAKGTVPYNVREADRMRRRRADHPELNRKQQQQDTEKRIQNKHAAYSALGSSCACCGEPDKLFPPSTEHFLQIDHVNNDGHKERRVRNQSGDRRRHAAILRGERPDLQLLCPNCNWLKKINAGRCPCQDDALALGLGSCA